MPKVRAYRGRKLHPLLRELEYLRERQGISQEKMAQMLRVSYSTYQRWLYSNQDFNPDLKTVEKIQGLLKEHEAGKEGERAE
ncbi:MAG: helix-turn-helix transcriptional regulator [Candidatus Bipolaricaulia bacterium]